MASFFGEVLAPRSRIIDDEDLDAQEGNFWRLELTFLINYIYAIF